MKKWGEEVSHCSIFIVSLILLLGCELLMCSLHLVFPFYSTISPSDVGMKWWGVGCIYNLPWDERDEWYELVVVLNSMDL
jgi:hypothetical protein